MSIPATVAASASILLQTGETQTSALSVEMLVVFAIIAAAVGLFVTQPIPLDVTALVVIVALVLLEPWTTISPDDGIAGFASAATITVLMMFVLSEGVRQTGSEPRTANGATRESGGSERGVDPRSSERRTE
ncbi:SLC13 family permease [Halovivax sp.]|uniref:SLC13 family permease n=1 Tax=Halovivax sp. TaxID=1935978 RepID=UPI0025C35951|nr:SLC13 family permease [Halovivax sp.]